MAKNLNQRKLNKPQIIVLSIIILLAIIFGFIISPLVFAKADKEALIKIPKGATIETVSDSLRLHLGNNYADKVIRSIKLQSSDVSDRHGAYLITKGMSPLRAGRLLTHGAQYPIKLTINGFRSLDLLAERISNKIDFTKDEFINTLQDNTLLSEYELTKENSLALFIDDSYEVYWSASPSEIIKKIGSNYLKVWNDERRQKAKKIGRTPAEVMTICSIVDEETNKADEKGKVARVYLNRLSIGMKLQADPTVRFAVGDFTIKRVKGEHLRVNSPYNTYLNNGLPPGPIRTTTINTIDALLNSNPSNDIYMCAKEDFSGYHNFAATYTEHTSNAKRYQDALDKQGIK
jgi:UPF0755 protein